VGEVAVPEGGGEKNWRYECSLGRRTALAGYLMEGSD
jgi:hypothetical protein